jgi:hypothetical protein
LSPSDSIWGGFTIKALVVAISAFTISGGGMDGGEYWTDTARKAKWRVMDLRLVQGEETGGWWGEEHE